MKFARPPSHKLLEVENIMPQRIAAAQITPADRKKGAYEAKVEVLLDDCTVVPLFTFYDDELYFSEREFEGLTVEQAHDLKHRKDVAYLQSS